LRFVIQGLVSHTAITIFRVYDENTLIANQIIGGNLIPGIILSMNNQHVYFITGGFGFLGQYIVQSLVQHAPNAELRVLVRTPRHHSIPIESFEQVRLITGDLTKPETFTAELHGVTAIVHNAALVSFIPADRDKLYQANVIGTRNLVQAAVNSGVQTFVYISSISAVALDPPRLSDETMIPELAAKEQDPYGYTKLIGEMEVRQRAGEIQAVILNPSVIIGPGSTRIDSLARKLRFFPVVPMLSTINSFVDVRDVAQAVWLALEKGRSGERYIVTSWNIDMLSFIRLALRVMNHKALVFAAPRWLWRAADGFIALLDLFRLNSGVRRISAIAIDKAYSNVKIRQELGWEPIFTLEQSLADTLKNKLSDNASKNPPAK
jgi:dihydroflavonol-4-reductase